MTIADGAPFEGVNLTVCPVFLYSPLSSVFQNSNLRGLGSSGSGLVLVVIMFIGDSPAHLEEASESVQKHRRISALQKSENAQYGMFMPMHSEIFA